MKKDFTLVMTASVNPNGMKGISAESQNGREDQYIRTLGFYAKQSCIPHILFVENSNWDLSRIKREVVSDKITYLSLNENSFPREWGKGYGEFLLLDRAIDCLQSGVMIKVTGRFPILNIDTMVGEFLRHDPLLLAVDVVRHNLYKESLGLDWSAHGCRTIIWACDIDFYRNNLYGRYREIPSKFFGAEELMEYVYMRNKNRKGVYPRLRHEPRLSGYAGAVNHAWITANNYDSPLARAKRGVRQFCRWTMPYLWL